jgi:hypothetical protein
MAPSRNHRLRHTAGSSIGHPAACRGAGGTAALAVAGGAAKRPATVVAPDILRPEKSRPDRDQQLVALVRLLARQTARDYLARLHGGETKHDGAGETVLASIKVAPR